MPEQTPQGLASLVRAKFPGVYDGLSDEELAGRVAGKYPEYRSFLRTPADPAKPSLTSLAGTALGSAAKSLVTAPFSMAKAVGSAAMEGAPGGVGGMIGNVAKRLVMDPMVESGKKAVGAANQGRLLEAAGYGGGALLPVLGPMATQFGEGLGSGDPRRMAETVGEAGAAALAGPAMRLGGKMAQGVGRGMRSLGESTWLRAAKIPEAVTKRTGTFQRTQEMPAGELEIARTVLDTGRGALTLKNVHRARRRMRATSDEIGTLTRTPQPIDTTPAVREMASELHKLGKEADPSMGAAASRVTEMTGRMGQSLPSDAAQTLKVAAGKRNADRYKNTTVSPAVARIDMAMRRGLDEGQTAAIPGLSAANLKFSKEVPAAMAMSKARARLGHHDPIGLTQAALGAGGAAALGPSGLLMAFLPILQRGGPLSRIGQSLYTRGGQAARAGKAMNTAEAAQAAALLQLLNQGQQ